MEVELKFWGDSEFNYLLGKPELTGRRNYFFGELELTIDWFKNQVEKQLAAVKGKFNSVLHTETEVDMSIHASLMDKDFRENLILVYNKLYTYVKTIKQFAVDIKSIDDLSDKAIEGIEGRYICIIQKVDKALFMLETGIELLRESKFSLVNDLSYTDVLEELKLNLSKTRVFIEEKLKTEEIYLTEGLTEQERWHTRDIISRVYLPCEKIEDYIYEFSRVAGLLARGAYSSVHVFGNAGYGKTHLAANICNTLIKKNLPAIFISGKSIIDSQTLPKQLKTLLDIPPAYSWRDFLDALNSAGKAFHVKIPIVIDGLNEVRDLDVVKSGLQSLTYEINKYANLVVITTCRNTYIRAFWKDEIPQNSVYLHGFSNENIREVVEKYFSYYKINADITAVSLEHFEHPLYLQIFCEAENHSRSVEKDVVINDQTMFEIFERYLNQCNEIISNKIGLNPRRKIISKKLLNLGKELWNKNTRSIELEDIPGILEINPNQNWDTTIQKNLEDENLLIYQDWNPRKDKEVVSFSYDLLGGYVIAKYLIQNYKGSISQFINEDYTKNLLFDRNFSLNHPLNEDINRCLAALLPKETNKYLMEYYKSQVTVNVTVRSWFEISPKLINQKAKDFIATLFKDFRNRNLLMEIAEKTIRQINHPLNAYYWSEILNQQSMAERDLYWSEHIRKHQELYSKVILLLEEKSKKKAISSYEKNYLNVIAYNIMWTLTTTVRSLRDRATRALYYYGRQFPMDFFNMLKFSFDINDPYISERMLASMYGITMARQNDFLNKTFTNDYLPIIGKGIYERMFKQDAKNYTTHILSRDYAERTIGIALLHHPELLTEEQIRILTSPFQNNCPVTWGRVDFNEERYDPLRMDFENYTLGRLVKNRSNYDFDNAEYKKVRENIYWRIFDLGYDGTKFKEIDNEIDNRNFRFGREDDGRKVDRYGKKYSWIAYFELAGWRKDQGKLDADWKEENFRISDLDIDPSFPEEPTKLQLIKESSFDSTKPLKDWVFMDDPPNLGPYFVLDEINGELGPWVLLDGYFTEENEEIEQSIFCFPRGLLVSSDKREKLIGLLNSQDLAGRWLPEIPGNYYTYAGEIPWSETFFYNENVDLEFVTNTWTGTEVVETEVLTKNGKELTKKESRELLRKLKSEKGLNIDIMDLLFFQNDIDYKPYESLFLKQGIVIEKKLVELEHKEEKVEKINIQIPVRENKWEDHNSDIIPGRNVSIPSKELASFLQLVSQPQTFDLYEKDGRKASMVIDFGEGFRNRQTFTYIRKDLLDYFLAEKNLALIWAIWGEREIALNAKDTKEKFRKEYGTDRENFQYIQEYK
ncbi:NACHT domain-containing protein [Virgibacillus halodenitrificans]|uniref:NACHT domain-containing protein n=1 Tax=Virgibacillus halodenitrificans TaxID=1482 RepID=UPI0012FD0DB4|nr:hypothetical protein [Virgibacillus halodenitrificans]